MKKDLGTYYGVREGGSILTSYGKPATTPSDWRVCNVSRLFDPVKAHSNASTNYDWLLKNLADGDPTKFVRVEVSVETINPIALKSEIRKARIRNAKDNLREEEIRALKEKMNADFSNAEADRSVFGGEGRFLGLALYDFEEGTFTDSNGEEKFSWRSSGTLKNRVGYPTGDLPVHYKTLARLLETAEAKDSLKVVRVGAKISDAEETALEDRANDARVESAMNKLDEEDIEALTS